MRNDIALLITALATTTTLGATAAWSASAGAISRGHQQAAFDTKRPKKPASELVPHSVHKVRVARRVEPYTKDAAHKTVTGKRATALAVAFDQMKTEPIGSVHCDIAGGPEILVTFHTALHTWRVQEAACTDIVVTRDGKSQPTLLTDPAWERAVGHDLGH